MAKTISNSVTGPVILHKADNPLLITREGSVTSDGAAADGIDGAAGTTWSVTNLGRVSSANGTGILMKGAARVANAGSISGVYGIDLRAGGTVTNTLGATLAGDLTGLQIAGAKGTINNAGSITGSITGPSTYAVTLQKGGSVTNTGSIIGAEDGILIQGGVGTVTNSGVITATLDDAVAMFAGGKVTNNAGGKITGNGLNGAGVFITGGVGTVTNSGSIIGPDHIGILLSSGTVTNNQFATITGVLSGVIINAGPGSVINAGMISSTAPDQAGIDFEAGGTVVNKQGGTVSGGNFGVFISGASGLVTNSGTIKASKYDGVFLGRDGSSVKNTAGGNIAGGSSGVFLAGNGTVTNAGTLSGTSTGADLQSGGTISNAVGGSMIGADFGAFITGASGAITNSGSMVSNHAAGLLHGGSLVNKTGGSLSGQSAGVFIQGGVGTVTNAGSIHAATGAGADIEGGGSLTNAAGATVSGGTYGVFLSGGSGTVSNNGTISGSSYAVKLADGGTNRVVVNSHAVFNGAVGGGSGSNSTLELAGGSGTLSGVSGGSGTATENGSSWFFLQFNAMAVDAGGTWSMTGSNSVAAITDDGTVKVAGSLNVTGAIDPASTGLFQLAGGASLEVASALGSTARISFASSVLVVDDFSQFGTAVGMAGYAGPQLQSFGTGSSVDLHGFGFDPSGPSTVYTPLTGVLQLANGGGQHASLDFQNASLGGSQFSLASDGSSGTLVTRV